MPTQHKKTNPIEIVEDISPKDFQKNYVLNEKPVILRNYARHWPAMEKWNYTYFQQQCGDVEVPLFSEAMAASDDNYLTAQETMRFGDYLNLIQQGPTQKRMFLFNAFQHIPSLCDDFDYPPIVQRYLKKYPFLFFGGESSYVDIHYDLDLSHVFLTQFSGKKDVLLFHPNCSKHLYRHPLTVSTNVDFRNLDLARYPRVQELTGYRATLEQGDTLFIPSGYWHYIYYRESGFSLSLRSRPEKLSRRLESWLKIFNLTVVDRAIAKTMGAQKWYDKKEHMAHKIAHKLRSG